MDTSLYMPSDARTDKDDTSSDFKVTLTRPLRLKTDKDYQIALRELIIPKLEETGSVEVGMLLFDEETDLTPFVVD